MAVAGDWIRRIQVQNAVALNQWNSKTLSFEMEHVRMMPFVLPDCPVPNTFSRWIWLEGCDFVHSIGLKAAILCSFIIIRL